MSINHASHRPQDSKNACEVSELFITQQQVQIKNKKRMQMLNPTASTYRRLAKSMQYAMQIPEGDALVFLIGKGNEHSNLEALETWVRETLCTLEDECGVAMLPFLLDRLEQTMNQWSAA